MTAPATPAFPSDRHQTGMTLRQWYAGQVQLPDDGVSIPQATAIMGEDPPQWYGNATDDIACVLWWAKAEAKYRVILADAMIAALKETGDA